MPGYKELVRSWENRWCWMLTYAEEAFFAGDEHKELHFATCARQWRNAIDELNGFFSTGAPMIQAVSVFEDTAYVLHDGSTSRFNVATGVRKDGTLDIAPEEVLFLIWRQTQLPKHTDAQLRRMWADKKEKHVS